MKTQTGTLPAGPFDLKYVIEGEGDPILVIGSSVYYPRTFSAELRKHHQFIFVDHRGYANARAPYSANDYTFDQVLVDIDAVRKHLGFDKVKILGHSGHSYMALEYTKRYPSHVSHLILIGAGPNQSASSHALAERHWQEAVCPERKAQHDRDVAHLPAEIAADPESRFITFCIRLGSKSWYDPEFDSRPLWRGVQVNMPIIDHLWGEVFRDLDIRQNLSSLHQPVLLCLGRFDYLVAPYWSWEPYRHDFKDLTVRVFDRSAHTPQLEESRLFDQVLMEWLSSRQGR